MWEVPDPKNPWIGKQYLSYGFFFVQYYRKKILSSNDESGNDSMMAMTNCFSVQLVKGEKRGKKYNGENKRQTK